jgi:hypothetical protein
MISHRFVGPSSKAGSSTLERHGVVAVEREHQGRPTWNHCPKCGALRFDNGDPETPHAPRFRPGLDEEGYAVEVDCVGDVLRRVQTSARP